MEIKQVDKVKILGYIRSHSIDDIYFSDLIDEVLNTKKYTVQDITIYFISYVEGSFKKDNFSDNIILKILKFIHTYFVYFIKDFKGLDPNYIETVNNFQVMYEEYLNRTKGAENEEIVVSISHILSSIKSSEIDSSTKVATSKETQDLNKRIEELQRKVKECERKIKEYQDNLGLYDKKIKHRDNKIEELYQEIEKQKNRVAELNNIISAYENSIKELNDILKDNPDDENKKSSGIDTLENLKELCKKLLQELSNLKTSYEIILVEKQNLLNRLRELESIKQEYNAVITRNKELQKEAEAQQQESQEYLQSIMDANIKNLIVKSLFGKERTLDDIFSIVRSNGYPISKEQLANYMRELELLMNISPSRLILGEKVYGIHHAPYKSGENFIVDSSGAYELDLLFASDFHIFGFNTDARIENYKRLLDYCDANGIKLVINLGDFFDWSKEGYQCTYDYYNRCLEAIEHLATEMPKLDGLHHLVLGGNHDVDNMYLGCDFLGRFVSKRDDFISLGHEDCTLCFNRNAEIKARFLLAHPRETIQKCFIANSIDSICRKMGVNESDYDFKFLGHHHSSFLDFERATCIVPSLTVDRIKNGAWHVKVYFTEKGIADIVFIPLVLDNELYPTSRILYRKN